MCVPEITFKGSAACHVVGKGRVGGYHTLVGIYLRVNFAPLRVQDPQDASHLDSYCPEFPQEQKI